jgi:hypothetical protein
MPLYFAYGSNMDVAAMRERAPASRPIGRARLARHRFLIMPEGYASVTRDDRRAVWGMIWDLALSDVPGLDRYESLHTGLYTKAVQPVLTETGSKRAIVYLGHSTRQGVPRPGYMEDVVAAAQSACLPAEYVAELSIWLPHAAKPAAAPRPIVPGVRPIAASPMARTEKRSGDWKWRP